MCCFETIFLSFTQRNGMKNNERSGSRSLRPSGLTSSELLKLTIQTISMKTKRPRSRRSSALRKSSNVVINHPKLVEKEPQFPRLQLLITTVHRPRNNRNRTCRQPILKPQFPPVWSIFVSKSTRAISTNSRLPASIQTTVEFFHVDTSEGQNYVLRVIWWKDLRINEI